MEIGVPAREAAADEGLTGEEEPPLERCDEFQPLPLALVGDMLVDEGMLYEEPRNVHLCK